MCWRVNLGTTQQEADSVQIIIAVRSTKYFSTGAEENIYSGVSIPLRPVDVHVLIFSEQHVCARF